MDLFEPVRRRAAALHGELVSKGQDPLDPYEFVQAALRFRELVLVWLPRGDSALKGSRALYDDQAGAIYCEAEADRPTRALLVAHELGHAELHAGSASCAETDVDPSRSHEAASVGLQRVEDYGARERRELQADVYARELLIPRTLSRELYLVQSLSSLEIASRISLPLALIRQQLFDALLLPAEPACENQGPSQPAQQEIDESQRRAWEHRGKPFQLQAGPGTGKTRTLIRRVVSLLDDQVDPASILILTFSNRAAGELAERLLAVAPEATPKIWVGTFHAFGLDLVRRYHDQLNLSPNPSLFDRSDAINVLEEILPTLPLQHYRNLWDPAMVLRDVVNAISRAKDEMVDPSCYRALAEAMDRNAVDEEACATANKCLEIAGIYEQYEHALRKHGGVDFGDLIMRPAQLLEQNPAIRIGVQLRHRHVLVDEYQDVNRASARLLKAIAGEGRNLWVVGDARQSIYRFRGASTENMGQFSSDYSDAVIDKLAINYRSTTEITQTFSAIAPRMGASEGMLPLELEARRGEGFDRPQLRAFSTPDDEAAGIAASVLALQECGVSLRNQAVLCRTNARLNDIATALEERGIPVLHLGSLFERDEIRDLLAVLSLAVDPFGDALLRVGAMPRYGLSLQDAWSICQYLRAQKQPALEGIRAAMTVPDLTETGRAGLARLARDLEGLESTAAPWEFLASFLLDRTRLIAELTAASSVVIQMRGVAIWQFLNFLREQGPIRSRYPIQSVLDRIRQMILLAEERDLRQVPAAALHLDAVRLMTVHGSKGLEFEAVHVPGMTVSSFPSGYRGQRCPHPNGMVGGEGDSKAQVKRAHEIEEECLFFVALSRARTHLRLYRAMSQKGGNARSASPFLAWLPAAMVTSLASPPTLKCTGESASREPIAIRWPATWTITDSRLVAYEKCPLRFFYTHVLGLGGARKPTAFTQTHDCLYELLRWHATVCLNGNPTVEVAETKFESIWQSRGPLDHAFVEDYRKLASRLIAALISTGEGKIFRDRRPLEIDLPKGRVVVEPNELSELADGTIIVGRISTGRRRSDEDDRLEYTLYQLAAHLHFGDQAVVQAVHLADEATAAQEICISDAKLRTRKSRSDEMLGKISSGAFPPKTDPVTCPRCPHFFTCASVPRGSLTLS